MLLLFALLPAPAGKIRSSPFTGTALLVQLVAVPQEEPPLPSQTLMAASARLVKATMPRQFSSRQASDERQQLTATLQIAFMVSEIAIRHLHRRNMTKVTSHLYEFGRTKKET